MTAEPAPHYRYAEITWPDLRAELEREIGQRRSLYPRRVAKGAMRQAEANREIALVEAIHADLARFRASEGCPARVAEPGHGFSWKERHNALTRELDWRARVYPDRVRAGEIDAAEAGRRTRRLACIRALYEFGYDWRPANRATAPLGPAGSGSPEQRDARIEWRRLQILAAHRDEAPALVDGHLRLLAQDDAGAANAVRAMLAPQEELAL